MKYAQVIEAIIDSIQETYHNGRTHGYYVSAEDYGFTAHESNRLWDEWLEEANNAEAKNFCDKWAKRHPKNADLASVSWLGKYGSSVTPGWVSEIGALGCTVDHSTLRLGWSECDGVKDYQRALAALSFVTELNIAVKDALRRYPDSWEEFVKEERAWRDSDEYKDMMAEDDDEEFSEDF